MGVVVTISGAEGLRGSKFTMVASHWGYGPHGYTAWEMLPLEIDGVAIDPRSVLPRRPMITSFHGGPQVPAMVAENCRRLRTK